MTDFEGLLKILNDDGVQFILVGGMAAIVHGAARVTFDLDVVYERSPNNFQKIAQALRPLKPRLRGASEDIPFLWDAETLARGLNFTLTTSLGDIDILGEITGGGGYDQLIPNTIIVDVEGMPCRCLDLDTLIRVKRAAGREKDRIAIEELEALRQERDQQAEGGS